MLYVQILGSYIDCHGWDVDQANTNTLVMWFLLLNIQFTTGFEKKNYECVWDVIKPVEKSLMGSLKNAKMYGVTSGANKVSFNGNINNGICLMILCLHEYILELSSARIETYWQSHSTETRVRVFLDTTMIWIVFHSSILHCPKLSSLHMVVILSIFSCEHHVISNMPYFILTLYFQ